MREQKDKEWGEIVDKFDFNTITNFDDHIKKSIPNYEILLETILSISDYFISNDSHVYDLGCSTGKLLKLLDPSKDIIKHGFDNSKLMPKIDEGAWGRINFKEVDLNGDFSLINASLVYSIFTLQFLKRERRGAFCDHVYKGLNKGGAFILCEKIYQEGGMMQEVMAFSHYDYKCKHFSEEEIIKKERDLRLIMKPNTLKQNMELLKESGFEAITPFWQSFNFIGLIAIK